MQEIYDLLMETFKAATEEMGAFRLDLSKPVERTTAALYASIYEEVDAGILLFNNKKYTGAYLILRPALEAHVDLIAVIKDPDYVDFMSASHDHELLRYLKNGDKGTNPFLKTLWNNVEVKSEIAEANRRLQEFASRKIRPLQVSERFARADMTEEYESIYNDLCCHTHNNVRALNHRHTEVDEQTKTLNLVINARLEESSIGVLLDGLLGIILSSSIYVHRHFKSPALKRFEQLDAKRTEILKKR